MTRNTKEVALIQIRSGKLSEMPKALHQSEFGLAKDANRLFIGNEAHPLLKNRTVFPYQNLELLTEFSELKDYFKYSYENNIYNVNTDADRLKLKEFLPIVVSCNISNPTIPSGGGTLLINGNPVVFKRQSESDSDSGSGSDSGDENTSNEPFSTLEIISIINSNSYSTNTYATIFPGGDNVITFVCTDNQLVFEDNNNGIIDALGIPDNITYDISMPVRKVTEKLDDNLNITDFGVKGDGSNSGQKIFNALVEVYKNFDNEQFFRNVFFPAGQYVFGIEHNEKQNIDYNTIFPLIGNLHIRGEGIDRTIITGDTNSSLLASYDDMLNEYSIENEYYNDGPSNVLIEDVTFESKAEVLCKLASCSNVTFNRVKFVDKTPSEEVASHKLVEISGIAEDACSTNIIFNECIFENSGVAIDIKNNCENITVNNCKFIETRAPSIVVGSNDVEDGWVRAVDIKGCSFEKIKTSESNPTAVILLKKYCKYVTTTSCLFDDDIIEKNGSTVAYKDEGVGEEFENKLYIKGDVCVHEYKFYEANQTVTPSETFDIAKWDEYQRYNYTDILDINTDDKKLLRFKFAQPRWEYINYLTNQSGETVITVDGKDADVNSKNGLNVIENELGLDIRAVGQNNDPNARYDVLLSMDNQSDLELGKETVDIEWKKNTQYDQDTIVTYRGIVYKCRVTHESTLEFNPENWEELSRTKIIIDKILQLNDKLISNKDGNENITIEPADNKVVEIKQDNYADNIIDKNDAVPNVEFIKKYSKESIVKHVSKEDLANISGTGKLKIAHFDRKYFGDTVHITGVTVNVRNPFYKVIPYLTNATADYQADNIYYRGDVVKGASGGTIYGVVKKTHEATDSNVSTNEKIEVIPATYTNDIKYVSLVATSGESTLTSELTDTVSYDYDNENSPIIKINHINIQKNNLFGFDGTKDFDTTKEYGDKNSEHNVKFQDRVYNIINGGSEEGQRYNSTMLHSNTLAKRLYDEGYVYKFDEDKNFNIDNTEVDNPYSLNYVDGDVYMNFFLEDGTKVDSSNIDTSLLNPAGDMIVKIDFTKEDMVIIPEPEYDSDSDSD